MEWGWVLPEKQNLKLRLVTQVRVATAYHDRSAENDMDQQQIENIIGDAFWQKKPSEPQPSESEWAKLESRFDCKFPVEFRRLHDLMANYIFEGGYLCVVPSAGKDDIATTYDIEKSTGRTWPNELIPFYDVGNGDYVCLKANECPDSAVYYIYHENDAVEEVHESLAAWLQDPEWFP